MLNHLITKDTPIFCYVQENKQNFIAKFKDNQSIINITLDTTTQKDEDNLIIPQNPKNIFISFIPFKDNQEANNTIAQKLQLTTQDLHKGYKDIDFRIPLLYLKDCEMFRGWEKELIENKITDIYFSYGKDKIKLDELSRHSTDLNLHIFTKDCKDDEEIELEIKTQEDNSFILKTKIKNNEGIIENIRKIFDDKKVK